VFVQFSESGHGDAPCSNSRQCAICSGSHSSVNNKCLVFADTKGVQELKVKDGLTFPEAWKHFLQLNPETTDKATSDDTASQRAAPPPSKNLAQVICQPKSPSSQRSILTLMLAFQAHSLVSRYGRTSPPSSVWKKCTPNHSNRLNIFNEKNRVPSQKAI
jgi:hypothetical protein